MNVLDLFSGIGGFSLGLEAAGMETVAFCEIVPHAIAVLKHHWPDAPEFVSIPVYDDVTTITAERLASDGITVDVICGGFPCQDISLSGSGAGLDGARSGLWFEFLRIIGEVRPRWVIIENVAALRSRGLDEVLRGLASIGYDAEWHCIPASAVGAPHRRDRIWIAAYPNSACTGRERAQGPSEKVFRTGADEPCGLDGGDAVLANANGIRQSSAGNASEHSQPDGEGETDKPVGGCELLADANKPRLEIKLHGEAGELPATERAHAWAVEPNVGRVAYGVPSRVDRITRLGNAVVPQIPEAIGRAIMRWEASR